MKPKHLSRNLFLNPVYLTAVLAVTLGAPFLSAASLSWDGADETSNGSLGGTGIWNLNTTANWDNGATDVVWTDSTGLSDTAIFGGSAGTVTLGSNLGAKGLVFNTAGYTVTGNTLSLGSAGIDASTLTSGTTTISSAVALVSGQRWQVGSGSTLAVNGTVTRSAGATVTLQGGGGTFSSSSLANTNGIVGPWMVVSNSGTAANNSANGYTYATVSGGNLVAYTGATSQTLTTAWGGIASGGTGTVNYDLSGAGTFGQTGLSRSVNTLRYTGSGANQTSNSTADLLTVNGIMNSGTGAFVIGGGSFQLNVVIGANRELVLGAMTSGITINNIIKNNAGGASGVTVLGNGTVTLAGANTYTGGTTVNGGTLQIAVSAAPGAANTGAFALAGGTTLELNATANNFNYAPTVTLNGATTISKVGSNQTNFTGTITGNGNALNVNTSASRLYINGNTTSGVSQFNVGGGAMGFDLATGNNQGGGAAVNVSSGASLYFANATVALANNITLNGGSGQGAVGALFQEGAGSPTLSGILTLASGNSSIGGNTAAANVGVTGQITGGGALTKIGTNTYTLSNALNNYSGGTTIAAGILAANNSAALGSGAVSVSNVSGAQLQLGSGVNIGNSLTINGGGVAVQGAVYVPTLNANATYSGPISITGVQSAGGHFATNGGVLTLSGAITSSVPVTVRAGTIVFSNTGSSYSALTIQSGTVKLGATDAIPVGASADFGISGAATLDLAGFNQTLSGLTKNTNAATVTNSGASDSTLTTTGTSSFGGVIQNGATNTTAVAVSSGALTLTATSTYTGGTTVNGGKLVVNGNISTSVLTTVNNTGTLGGSGTVGALTAASGGTVAPGNSPGILNAGNTDLQSGSTLGIELNGAVVGTDYDQLNVSGSVSLAGALSLSLGYVPVNGALFFILANDSNDAISGTFSGLADNSMFNVGGQDFQISYSGDSTGQTFTGGNDVVLMAVPEPGAALLGGLGVLALLRRRRSN